MSFTVEVEELLVSQQRAAQMLDVTPRTLYNLRHSGQIVARRLGRKVVFSVAELRRYVDSLPAAEDK